MSDAAPLEFLETAVRHSRHYDLLLHFITQTGGEFALTPAARTIANLCSLTVIHRVQEEAEKLAEGFRLSEREVSWIRTSKVDSKKADSLSCCSGSTKKGGFRFEFRQASSKLTNLTDPTVSKVVR